MADIKTIRDLFDENRTINRKIETVITYSNESKLESEISEYVVTDRLEESFGDLLKKMNSAITDPVGGHDIGVWVSGFYGSGKSSFTKYLGFALDRNKMLGGKTFLDHLKDRLRSETTKALFNTVSRNLDPHVIFLDLGSEMSAGAEMQDVSSVLRNKILKDSGYSNDIKIAELELMLEKEGRFEEFKEAAKEDLDGKSTWESVHNKPLISNTLCDRLARQFYPNIWKNAGEFSNIRINSTTNEREQAQEMVDLVKRKSGKNNIIFIVDEVGQYVAARPELIMKLDGFSRNLKEIGQGSVWLFATAQQTLTEDRRSATFNSPDLYKLKDRFPITVHLEATDIKEICHKRLLTKSTTGNAHLANLFKNNNAALRLTTQLLNAQHYDSKLDNTQFLNLYPFLPAHFEILLQLLGKLARRTGGLGLRSAIKVVQDVLIDNSISKGGVGCLADKPVGTLATTVTFYDCLEKEIISSFPQVADGVKRVQERFGRRDEPFVGVAKTIAILQILENLPANETNIAALMLPTVQSPSLKDAVTNIIQELLKSDSMVPLGEKDGCFTFLSRAAIQWHEELEKLEVRVADKRARVHDAILKIFDPLPKVMVNGNLGVTAGLKTTQGGGTPASLGGEKHTLQWLVDLVEPSQYDKICSQRVQDSQPKKEDKTLFVQGRIHPKMEEAALTAARCTRFLNERRASTDSDVKDFIKTVEQKLDRATNELTRLIREELLKGSFIACGIREPVTSIHQQFDEASNDFLRKIASKVYERFSEAPYQAETIVAERFLKTDLSLQTTATDPLTLVHTQNGQPMINHGYKALITIRDYLSIEGGEIEGRVLLDHFLEPPFGWSKDTTRYLIAGLLMGSIIKLRISGADHLIRNEDTIKALANNKSIGSVGIQLRDNCPNNEQLLLASERLKELTGEDVLPLEEAIGMASKKHLPKMQLKYASLAKALSGFSLLDTKHSTRAEELGSDIAAVLQGDGTDAINRFGKEESPIYHSLLWARKTTKALEDDGLAETLNKIVTSQNEWKSLPNNHVTASHHTEAIQLLENATQLLADDEFYQSWIGLQTLATTLESKLKAAKSALIEDYKKTIFAEMQLTIKQNESSDLSEEERYKIQEAAKNAEVQTIESEKSTSELLGLFYEAQSAVGEVKRLIQNMTIESSKRHDSKVLLPKQDFEINTPNYFTRKDQVASLKNDIDQLHEQMDGTKAIRIVWKTKYTEEGSL